MVQPSERPVDDREAGGDQREQRAEHQAVEALRYEIGPADAQLGQFHIAVLQRLGDQREQRAEHQAVEALRYEIGPVEHLLVLVLRRPRSGRLEGRPRARSTPPWFETRSSLTRGPLLTMRASGVVAEIAAERVWLLHQRRAWQHVEDLPEVLLVFHVFRRLALDDEKQGGL